VAQLQAGAPLGTDALAFDRTIAGVCSAYASTYRAGIPNASSLARIAASGAVTIFINGSPGPLHGVAVPLSGDQFFGSYVNADGFPFLPGLARGAGTTFSRVIDAAPTLGAGSNPFSDLRFNRGPVGPAFDDVTYNGSTTSRDLYFGNWSANGDLVRVSFIGGAWQATTLTSPPLPAFSIPLGERITAIAFEQRKFLPTMAYHRYLVIGHNTTLSILDLDPATGFPSQVDVNLATAYVPNTTRGESNVESILSIAVHPTDGDIFVEVRGNGAGAPGGVKNRFLLNVDAHDHSLRHELVVQQDQHKAGLPVPVNFGTSDGRIVITPAYELLRFTPIVDLDPNSFAIYTVTPP